jgi:hypothetical protein
MTTVQEDYAKGTEILSRDGKHKGDTTGTFRMCQTAGCTGLRIGVRWRRDKKITWLCSKSLDGNKLV